MALLAVVDGGMARPRHPSLRRHPFIIIPRRRLSLLSLIAVPRRHQPSAPASVLSPQ